MNDVRDEAALSAAVREAQPEVVFHLAAQALVRASYAAPVATFDTNVMGTVKLLDAVRQVPSVRAVVVITTDKCYENQDWPWAYRETDKLGGYDPYSASKACTELVVSAYRQSFFSGATHPGLATARAGNVIGGGDWAEDRLVPDVLRAFASGQAAVLRMPSAVRPWQHVLEPLRGYMQLANRLFSGDATWARAWNFGPLEADTQSAGWVAQRLADAWGEGAALTAHESPDMPHETQQLRLDTALARTHLNWHPGLRLEQALTWVVTWEQARLRGEDMRAVSIQQIDAYLKAFAS